MPVLSKGEIPRPPLGHGVWVIQDTLSWTYFFAIVQWTISIGDPSELLEQEWAKKRNSLVQS